MDPAGPCRRSSTRASLHYECTLSRRHGTPVTCTTLDVGRGGMCVTSERPLAVDELLTFDLPLDGAVAHGEARVLREQGFHVYALRFESIPGPTADLLGSMAEQAAA